VGLESVIHLKARTNGINIDEAHPSMVGFPLIPDRWHAASTGRFHLD
jgi:hypothetical protein